MDAFAASDAAFLGRELQVDTFKIRVESAYGFSS